MCEWPNAGHKVQDENTKPTTYFQLISDAPLLSL
jgi:hypothetical protein